MYKYFLIVSFIMLALGPPGAKAQQDGDSCWCVHHEGEPNEYYPCLIPEDAILDTCNFVGVEWDNKYGKLNNCSDYIRAIIQKIGTKNSIKRQYYKPYSILVVFTDSMPKDLTMGEINLDQIPQILNDFKIWVDHLSGKFGNLKIYLYDAFYNAGSILSFQVRFNNYINRAEFIEQCLNGLYDHDTTDKINFFYYYGPSHQIDCEILGVRDSNYSNQEVSFINGVISLTLNPYQNFTLKDMRLFDYSASLLSIPEENIYQTGNEIKINTDFIAKGLYLLIYHNFLFKFIRE